VIFHKLCGFQTAKVTFKVTAVGATYDFLFSVPLSMCSYLLLFSETISVVSQKSKK